MNPSKKGIVGAVLLAFTLGACAAAEAPTPREAVPRLVPLSTGECTGLLHDDSSLESLNEAAARSGAYFAQAGSPTVRALDHPVARVELANMATVAREASSVDDLGYQICSRFQVYHVDLPSPASVGSYIDSEIEARRKRDDYFRYPVFEPPSDLVEIDLHQFCPTCEQRLTQGRLAGSTVVPYYSRAEIDAGALNGNDYEIGWLADPIEAYLLQMRGAGTLAFEDGTRMYLGYASNNGRAPVDVGARLVQQGQLAPQAVTLSAVGDYLRAHREQSEAIVHDDQRVVFFRVAPVGPVGNLGVPITTGRTVAADPRYYPRGSLLFLRLSSQDGVAMSRFVFAQDERTGIKGADHLELFAGSYTGGVSTGRPVPGEIYIVLPN